MSQKIIVIDAFTDKPFTGNPAAVCLLENEADENWMRQIAAEMNLSETAFFYPFEEGYNLRWFTPTVEVDLCGHATLATAFYLFSENIVDENKKIKFNTKSGQLTAKRVDGKIELDFPALESDMIENPIGLANALNFDPIQSAKSKFDYLLEAESETVIRSLKPNFSEIKKHSERGVIVTAQSETGEHDFVSRFFAPAVGIDEDPVTGSAHCMLAPYWYKKLNKNVMSAFQASPRTGMVEIELKDDRVLLRGNAVKIFENNLVVL